MMTSPTTLSETRSNIVSLFNATTRPPRPYIRKATEADLAWDPQAIEQFTVVDGKPVRSGRSYAIVRPGMERWPLGHVSEFYRPTMHRELLATILASCAGQVTHLGSLIAGIGVHVAHSFRIEHMSAGSVAGAQVHARLVVTNGNTGRDKVRACMVVYVGGDAVGCVVRTEALHVGSQPERWQGDVDAMVEKAICVQDALVDLLKAASERELAPADLEFFKARGMVIRDKNAKTALDAVRSWHRGGNTTRTEGKLTWGVWERRLDDEAITALVVLLGRDVHGAAIDGALGYARPRYAAAK